MSRDFLFIIVIWVILCAIAIPLWVLTVNTEQAVFYTHYYSFMQFVTSMGAALLCYRTMMIFGPNDNTGTAWELLSIGLFFWSAGAVLEGIYPVLYQGVYAPFPWYADIGFLMLVPFVLLALKNFRKNVNVDIPLAGWIAALVAFVGAFSLALWINIEGFQALGPLPFFVTLAYIIFDSILLAMTVATASILVGSVISRPWWFMLVGLFIFYLGDITYAFLRNIDKPDAGGVILDLTWPIAFGLIAIAATTARAIYKESR